MRPICRKPADNRTAMSRKKQRLKHTPRQRCREESIRAESAGRKGRIALWKIAVPVIIVLFLLHCRAWHPEEAWLLRTAFSTGSYQSLNAVVASVLFVIGMGAGCCMCISVAAGTRRKEQGGWGETCFTVCSGGRFVGIVYECGSRFSLLAECMLYFRR